MSTWYRIRHPACRRLDPRACPGDPSRHKRNLSFFLILLLTACAHAPSLEKSEVPSAFITVPSAEASVWPALEFWRGFSSPELEALIAEAERNNTDLAAAAARITQAEGALGQASAGLFPQIGIGADAFEDGTKANGGDFSSRKSFSAQAGASYEVDLWGRNRSLRRAAKASLLATGFDQETVALTVTAGVANTYLSLLSIRDRLVIARANIENAERVMQIVESRVRNGAASPLDLAQQQAELANQRTSLPSLMQDERFALASLAVLLGRAPEGFEVAAQSLDGVGSPVLAPGLPSDLLLRRPDLKSAEYALKSADADVDAARAAFFPQIDLTGAGGLQSAALATLFSGAGAFYSIGASLTQPIFAGGQIAGAYKEAKGRRAERIAAYRGAVFQAFADVETALGERASQEEQFRLRSDQAEAAARAFRLAEAQYREGAVDFVTVLDAQRTLFSAEDQRAQAKRAALQASVTLYRALGGGWSAK